MNVGGQNATSQSKKRGKNGFYKGSTSDISLASFYSEQVRSNLFVEGEEL